MYQDFSFSYDRGNMLSFTNNAARAPQDKDRRAAHSDWPLDRGRQCIAPLHH